MADDKCTHGIPLFPKTYCVDCDLIWETHALESAREQVSLHEMRLRAIHRVIAMRDPSKTTEAA